MELTLNYLAELELDLGTLLSLSQMSGGYRNDNYVLVADSGRYRVRVPKYPTDPQQVYAEQEVLDWAAKRSRFPVPMLKVSVTPNGTPMSIFPFIEADLPFDIHNDDLVYQAGRALSEYHLAVAGYRGPYPFRDLPSSLNDVLFSPLIDLEKILLSAIIQIRGKFHDKKRLYARIQRTDIKGIP
ncbi:MAG: phosphotransferase, partial [Firmicutes bacterium]|nr:phosphotransferase [Bacillota bacterium]